MDEEKPFWSPPAQDPALIPFRRQFDAARDPQAARNALGISELGGVIGGEGEGGGGTPPATEITDLTAEVQSTSQIWLYWTPVPDSKGTVIYRSRTTGPTPHFQNWEACRVGYPGDFFKDGIFCPLDSGREYTYQAAAYYDNGEGPLSDPITRQTKIAFTSGYQTFVFYSIIQSGLGATTGGICDEWTGTYNVASVPPRVPWGGGNIYYFMSTQDYYFAPKVPHPITLLQPVVQFGAFGDEDNPEFGGEYWVAANWMADDGHYYIGDFVVIDVGTPLVTGIITRNAPFDYTVGFLEYPEIDLVVTGVGYEALVVGMGLEIYHGSGLIDDWDQMPGDVVFDVLNLTTSLGGPVHTVALSGTRPELSGTQVVIYDNNTPHPEVQVLLRHDNDWIPVVM